MIKYHPNTLLMDSFIKGELPLALSVAMSAHIELCDICQQHAQAHTHALSDCCWKECNESQSTPSGLDNILNNLLMDLPDQDNGINRINRYGSESVLPLALQRHEPTRWRQFGQIRRGRIPSLSDGKIRANLMEIAPNSQIPQHKHKGYELTLLLAGAFSDENGDYQVGDFLYLEQSETHTPITTTGCLCYTVSNAPLYFTQGVNQWLNPLGYFLY